ncbi:MAG: glycosyltransferase family 2 protein [Armatimonadetes bacterium]|nr:glycosyltransferase family 2 protein [Armatimonadota bacterium]
MKQLDRSDETYLSVVIPAYNEVGRLGSTLEKVIAYLDEQPYASQIIVVDDGSGDATAELARSLLEERPDARVLVNEENRGKGYSVRRGMLEAAGQMRLFSDADLSTPIEHAADLLAAIDAGADIAIGSRGIQGADIARRQPLLRQTAGKMFSFVQRTLLGTGIVDTQCGFKLFTQNAAELVFPHQRLERWAFDAELLFIANRLGLKIAEVPVRWINSEDTRVRMFTDGLGMVRDLWRIRRMHHGLRRK